MSKINEHVGKVISDLRSKRLKGRKLENLHDTMMVLLAERKIQRKYHYELQLLLLSERKLSDGCD